MDSVWKFILEISEDKIPLVFKVLDKSDKVDDTEFEKYVIDTFQDEFIIQGLLKLKDIKSTNELLKKFDNIPGEFYEFQTLPFTTRLKIACFSKLNTFSKSTLFLTALGKRRY